MEKFCRWVLKSSDPSKVEMLAKGLGVSRPVAAVLVNRGMDDLEEAREFLKVGKECWGPPSIFPQMEAAVDRVKRALVEGETIGICGDYDVDGITSTAILTHFLASNHPLGEKGVIPHIPHRLSEGYGLSKEIVDHLYSQGVTLLITVDCGISSVEEVNYAKEKGIDVIVTDHHQPSDELPPALAVLDPAVHKNMDPLAGVGVALKMVEGVAESLWGEEGGKRVLREYMDLALLGTIADVVPLVRANRFIARYGLRMMEQRRRPGIAALMKVAGRKGQVNSWEISFILAPRLNAAGRMGDAMPALELLLKEDERAAMELAKRLHSINQQRQKTEEGILRQVMREAERMGEPPPFAVFFGEDWHPGVIGIVAARVADRLRRPTALVSFYNGQMGRGSARTWEDINLLHILNQCSHHLERLGGHTKAAGFGIRKEKAEEFREAVVEVASSVVVKERERVLELEAVLEMDDLNGKLLNDLRQLEPYGEANPQPLFLMREVTVQNPKIVGRNHLKFHAVKGNTVAECIAFDLGDTLSIVQNTRVDLAVYPTLNVWNGTKTLQLEVRGIRPACL